jgi:RNA polymerase sigma-70 factor (ECF subfamily)
MDTSTAAGMDRPVSRRGEVERDDEAGLLERVRSGDREAAEWLVERTYRPVYASLVRLCGGDRDLAADLTQECFRRAWQALGDFDGRSGVFTWLYRIAYNAFLNSLRRPRLAVPLDGDARVAPPDPSPSAEEELAASESRELLRAAVLALPDDQRFLVTARYWAGLSVREIATGEGVSTVAIRKRLRRILASLEEALERRPS